MTPRRVEPVVVEVPTSRVRDWPSFHEVFAAALGFADYYGHNNNAFLDILLAPQAPDVGADVPEGGLLVLHLDEDAETFAARCPDQFEFLISALASVSNHALRLGAPGAFITLASP